MPTKIMLYYRDESSHVGITPDPDDLPAAQRWEFMAPDDITEGVQERYRNNIKVFYPPRPDGVRKANIIDNGFAGWRFRLFGNVLISSALADTRIQAFRKLKNVSSTSLPFGVFGLSAPNWPAGS
jgi:hypothetical protein